MSNLTPREIELVSLGAALGSNCVPCIEYHIPQARKAGLTDKEIHTAIQHADKVRQVPARKVLEAALNLLPQVETSPSTAETGDGCNSGVIGNVKEKELSTDCRMPDAMKTIMSRMMSSCAPIIAKCSDHDVPVKVPKVSNPEETTGCC